MNNFYDYTGGLASVISLAVLQLPSASDAVEDDFTKSSSPESSATPPVNGPAAPARPASTPSGTLFYIRDSNAIKTITTCIQQCPSNPACSPAAMGWVYLLNTIQSLMLINTETEWNEQDGPVTSRSVAAEFYGNLLPGLFPTTVDVGIKNLAEPSSKPMLHVVSYLVEPSIDTSSGRGFCLNCEEDGFRMKNVLADLVRKSQPYIEFSAPLISTTFLVNGVEYSEISDFRKFLEQETCEPNGGLLINDWSGSPSNRFYLDHGALKLLDRAKNRFPYEPLPLLKIVRGLATENSATIDFLTHMTTYTHSLPYGFKDYDDVGDPETGRIQLHSDLVLFPPRDGDMFENSSGQYLSSGGIIIPSGTIGVQISSGSARQVVAWQYGYNALSLFGRVLECALVPQQRTAAFADLCSAEVVNAIISLLTGLVVSSKEAEDAVARVSGHYTIPPVLEEASDMLGRNRDIISIVFDIIDRELNCYSISGIPFITGIEFINSLVHVVPGRVWPYLARSSLLERHGRGGALAGIVSAVEVVHGSYEFTLACLVLFESLVDEAVRSSAIHKGQSKSLVLASKAALATSGTAGMGVSDIVQRGILLGFTRVAVGIFESYRGFKYTKTIQKLKIGTIIARTFSSILEYVYGVDEFSDSENKITSVLTPCAEYLVSVFLSAGISELPLEPIFGAITDGVQTPESSLYLRPLEAWVEQVTQIVKLADVLVRVRLYLEFVPS
jgi:nuclear pore complex protein Nup188